MNTIIIINYRNEELTSRYVLEELQKLKGAYNVVIVNNGATNTSNSELACRLDAPICGLDEFHISSNNRYIISSQENLGFAKGNNLAVQFVKKYLHSDYLLFSNNDILIQDAEIFDVLIRKYESDSMIGMIGPRIIGLDGIVQSPEPYYPFWDNMIWQYLSKLFMSAEKRAQRFMFNYPSNAEEGFHYKVMGAFFLMSTKNYLDCGMMDPNTFLFFEEPILSERLKSIGKGVYYYPRVSVVHVHGSTIKKNVGFQGVNKYMLESMSYYYCHYRKIPHQIVFLGTLINKLIVKLK